MRKTTLHWAITVLLFLLGQLVFSQSSMLEKKVSFSKQTITTAEALKLISLQTGCVFSYAGGVVNPEAKVTIAAQSKSVRDVLFQMFGGNIQATEKKQFVVLTKSKMNKSQGYVQDYMGEPVANATVYDPYKMRSVRTDEYGYFEIKLKSDSIPPLVVNKEHFEDTLVVLMPNDGRLNYITMQSKDTTWLDKAEVYGDSLRASAVQLQEWTKERINSIAEIKNVRDSLRRTWQVSFVPFLGTNGRLSGNVTNHFSLNLLGGVNNGVNVLEIGGLFNINRSHVRGFQVAGLTNSVFGKVEGMQVSGLLSVVEKSVTGLEIAGLMNIAHGKVVGMQAAGLMNIDRSGFSGMQVAGLMNVSDSISQGLQIAGLMNVAHEVRGVQIAGLLNRAHRVTGAQIGFINMADSVQGGVFGFLSFVKSGYHQLAPYFDDLGYAGMQWRTGSQFFYNIIDVAVRVEPVKSITHFAYGYGIGLSTNNHKPWVWNNDFTLHTYVPGKWRNEQNYLGRWYTGVERRFGRVFAVAAGLSFNFQAYERGGQSIAYTAINDKLVWSDVNDTGWSYRGWLGWKVGVRFNLNPGPRRL